LEIFTTIFKILKSGKIELTFFEKSIKDVKKQLLERAGLDCKYQDIGIDTGIKLTDLSMPIRYNITVQDQIDINIDTKTKKGVVRFTLGNQKIKINKETNRPYVDSSKTNTAMFVNTVHLIDAYYLRKIVNTLYDEYDIKILCVHDGFGIDYTQIDKLMIVACQKIITNLDISIVETNNNKIIADGLNMVAVLV
jgi:DNA-directed RNA polymerase